MSAFLALVSSCDAEIGTRDGIELHFAAWREWVEVHDDSIATVFGIDGENLSVDAHVAKVPMHGAGILLVKELENGVEVDMPQEATFGVVSLVRCLRGFAVHPYVIGGAEPGLEQAVEIIESERGGGTDFGFELALRGLEEAFDESAGGRIAWRPMQ